MCAAPVSATGRENEETTIAVAYDKTLCFITCDYTTFLNSNDRRLPPYSQHKRILVLNLFDGQRFALFASLDVHRKALVVPKTAELCSAHIKANGQQEADRQHTSQAKTNTTASGAQVELSMTVFQVKCKLAAHRKLP